MRRLWARLKQLLTMQLTREELLRNSAPRPGCGGNEN